MYHTTGFTRDEISEFCVLIWQVGPVFCAWRISLQTLIIVTG